ncbi:hypothetical protein D3C86_2025120 [compost metagenome]
MVTGSSVRTVPGILFVKFINFSLAQSYSFCNGCSINRKADGRRLNQLVIVAGDEIADFVILYGKLKNYFLIRAFHLHIDL